MNDSKKLMHKFGTCFWWFIAILPLIFLVGGICFNVLNKNMVDFDFENNILVYWNDFYNNIFVSGKPFIAIKDMLDYIINDVCGFDKTNSLVQFIIIQLYWFICCWFIHICVDLVLILPRLCQKLLNKIE